jgi:hypothetical protein
MNNLLLTREKYGVFPNTGYKRKTHARMKIKKSAQFMGRAQ